MLDARDRKVTSITDGLLKELTVEDRKWEQVRKSRLKHMEWHGTCPRCRAAEKGRPWAPCGAGVRGSFLGSDRKEKGSVSCRGSSVCKGTEPETACPAGNQVLPGLERRHQARPGPAAAPECGSCSTDLSEMQILRGSQAYLLSNSGNGALQALS